MPNQSRGRDLYTITYWLWPYPVQQANQGAPGKPVRLNSINTHQEKGPEFLRTSCIVVSRVRLRRGKINFTGSDHGTSTAQYETAETLSFDNTHIRQPELVT